MLLLLSLVVGGHGLIRCDTLRPLNEWLIIDLSVGYVLLFELCGNEAVAAAAAATASTIVAGIKAEESFIFLAPPLALGW